MSEIYVNNAGTSLIINGTAIGDLIEGDTTVITPVNPVTSQTNSTTGMNVTKHVAYDVHDVVVSVTKLSDSDVFLNNLKNQVVPEILTGSFKQPYNKDGTDLTDNWVLSGGTFTDQPTATDNNVEGNHVMEYTLRFRNAKRVI